MPFYKTRTVVRDAEQWTGDNEDFLAEKFGEDILFTWGDTPGTLNASIWVEANEQWLDLEVGEWIIKDSLGIYPCKDDMFREKYEAL